MNRPARPGPAPPLPRPPPARGAPPSWSSTGCRRGAPPPSAWSHQDLGRALAGALPLLGGRALLDGRPYRPRSVAAALRRGVGLVPGNREEEGCAPGLTVRENFLANPRATGFPAWRWTGPRRERAEATALIDRFSVHPRDSEAPIATLSGGNQQKVVVGRWLHGNLRLLILEEPTASVDVGAKAAVHRILDEAARAGLAVLLVSTDFEEVAGLCHRALVFGRGSVLAEPAGAGLTVTELTRTASALPPVTGNPATGNPVTGNPDGR